ncbi:uncharacterized protein ISCGN_029315 [Ixodes scapularis]
MPPSNLYTGGQWSDTLTVKKEPEEILPTLMDENAQFEEKGRMPPPSLHTGGQWSDTPAVKEGHTVFGWKRRWLAPGTVPTKCLPDRSADGKRARSRPRLEPARAGIRDASASEPEEILPTPIGETMHSNDTEPEDTLPTSMGESVHSNDCGRVFVASLYLERGWDNAAAVKKEPEEILPTSVDESARFEDDGRMPPSNLYTGGQWSDTLTVKKEPEEILPTLMDENAQFEEKGRMPPPSLHTGGQWSDTPAVKEEPVDAEESWNEEETDPSSSREHFGKTKGSTGQA